MSQFDSTGSSAIPSVPLSSRWLIIAICLLHGGLLYFFISAGSSQTLENTARTIYGQTLALTLPLLFALSLVRLNDRRFWGGMALLTIALVGLAAWANSNVLGMPQDGVIFPFYLCLSLLVFFILPWLQVQAFPPATRYRYANLAACYGQNILCAMLTGLLVLMSLAVMSLCAALFGLIGIKYFHELLFSTPWFTWMVYGVMLGISVVFCRTQSALIDNTKNIFRFILKGLLPLVSFVSLIFLFALPFTGLKVLSEAWSAARLLVTMAIILLLLVNIVRQTDSPDKPYLPAVRLIVNASILLLPIYAVLALYASGLRISQYGWTPSRVWGVLIIVMTLLTSICYSLAVIDKRPDWLPRITQFNKPLSLLVVLLIVAANSPLLDPYRISVNSQMARLDQGEVEAQDFDLRMLSFDTGRRGHEALTELLQHPDFVDDPKLLVTVKNAIAQTSQWGASAQDDAEAFAKNYRVEDAKKVIQVAKGSTQPEELWWKSLPELEEYHRDLQQCFSVPDACIVNAVDLNNDKQKEQFFCDTSDSSAIDCRIYAKRSGKWAVLGRVYLYSENGTTNEELVDALRNGKVKPLPRRWADVEIQGKRQVINYDEDQID